MPTNEAAVARYLRTGHMRDFLRPAIALEKTDWAEFFTMTPTFRQTNSQPIPQVSTEQRPMSPLWSPFQPRQQSPPPPPPTPPLFLPALSFDPLKATVLLLGTPDYLNWNKNDPKKPDQDPYINLITKARQWYNVTQVPDNKIIEEQIAKDNEIHLVFMKPQTYDVVALLYTPRFTKNEWTVFFTRIQAIIKPTWTLLPSLFCMPLFCNKEHRENIRALLIETGFTCNRDHSKVEKWQKGSDDYLRMLSKDNPLYFTNILALLMKKRSASYRIEGEPLRAIVAFQVHDQKQAIQPITRDRSTQQAPHPALTRPIAPKQNILIIGTLIDTAEMKKAINKINLDHEFKLFQEAFDRDGHDNTLLYIDVNPRGATDGTINLAHFHEESIDLVVFMYTPAFDNAKKLKNLLNQVMNVVKPGGKIVIPLYAGKTKNNTLTSWFSQVRNLPRFEKTLSGEDGYAYFEQLPVARELSGIMNKCKLNKQGIVAIKINPKATLPQLENKIPLLKNFTPEFAGKTNILLIGDWIMPKIPSSKEDNPQRELLAIDFKQNQKRVTDAEQAMWKTLHEFTQATPIGELAIWRIANDDLKEMMSTSTADMFPDIAENQFDVVLFMNLSELFNDTKRKKNMTRVFKSLFRIVNINGTIYVPFLQDATPTVKTQLLLKIDTFMTKKYDGAIEKRENNELATLFTEDPVVRIITSFMQNNRLPASNSALEGFALHKKAQTQLSTEYVDDEDEEREAENSE